MGNCSSQCDKNLNDANEVQINENPEKDDTAGGDPYKRKKTKFPKNVIIKDDDDIEDNNNKDENKKKKKLNK